MLGLRCNGRVKSLMVEIERARAFDPCLFGVDDEQASSTLPVPDVKCPRPASNRDLLVAADEQGDYLATIQVRCGIQ